MEIVYKSIKLLSLRFSAVEASVNVRRTFIVRTLAFKESLFLAHESFDGFVEYTCSEDKVFYGNALVYTVNCLNYFTVG